jgi:transcription termination/antitermination protein NusG
MAVARKSSGQVEETAHVEETAAEEAETTSPPAIEQPADLQQEIPGRHWYAIHTYSGYENKVKVHLEARINAMGLKDKIFRVVVPTEEEMEIKGGQRRTVTRKIFPGYVLIDLVLDDDTWHVVRGTPGVTGFVGGTSTEPVPLQEHEIRYILREPTKAGEEAPAKPPKPKVTFQVGQNVKVVDGPFAEFIGTVHEIHPERNKVTVLVSFFGRETPVTLDFLQVEKV